MPSTGFILTKSLGLVYNLRVKSTRHTQSEARSITALYQPALKYVNQKAGIGIMILTRAILHRSSKCEMLQKKMVVYKIQRLSDGKIYIGKTTRTLAERLKEHLRNNVGNSYIDYAIEKYGIENFDVTIVEKCATPEELNERENYWIKTLNCQEPNGFNRIRHGKIIRKLPKKNATFKTGKKTRPQKYAVICIETEQIFESITSAAKFAGVTKGAISSVIHGRRNKAGG